MLDYNSIVPLYEQVSSTLKTDIQNGVYETTRRLPTEDELAEKYQVSRITVRRAVSDLVEEGLVEKKQGKGTFIRSPKIHKDLKRSGLSFTELCAINGKTASTKLLVAAIDKPTDARVIDWLGLQPDEDAVRIKRLRYMDNIPCVIEDNYFPKKYSFLLGMNLEHDSLYRYLREEKGYEIVTGEMVLRIVHADTKTAKLLEVSRNSPLLASYGRVFCGNGEILHTCSQIGYGEDFEFIVR